MTKFLRRIMRHDVSCDKRKGWTESLAFPLLPFSALNISILFIIELIRITCPNSDTFGVDGAGDLRYSNRSNVALIDRGTGDNQRKAQKIDQSASGSVTRIIRFGCPHERQIGRVDNKMRWKDEERVARYAVDPEGRRTTYRVVDLHRWTFQNLSHYKEVGLCVFDLLAVVVFSGRLTLIPHINALSRMFV